jgi:hypothetical protein
MVDVMPLYSGADTQIGQRGCPLHWVGQGLAGFGVPDVTAGAELTED